MTLSQLIGLVIQVSVFLVVLTLGLRSTFADVFALIRNPSLLIRSILSMNIIMLAFAVLAVKVFNMAPAVEIALVALALSPVPPVFPNKHVKAGGSVSYAAGLLFFSVLFSIVFIPVALALAGSILGSDLRMPIGKVASIVLLSAIVPLIAGIAIAHFSPHFAARIARPISIAATVALLAAIGPVLFIASQAVWTLVGSGVAIALVLFTVVGVTIGHFLGGPNPDDRTLLAIATGARHPGIAIAIASVNFPDDKVVMAVILFHLVIGGIVALPYINWRKREHVLSVLSH